MTAPSPWLVRTEGHARRLGSPVSIASLSIPMSADVDERALGEWHLGTLEERHAGLTAGELESIELGHRNVLMRYGRFAGPEAGHLVAVYRPVRGMLQALVAAAPTSESASALSQALLEWIEHEGSVHLTVEEFRAVERVRGAAPAAYIPRVRMIESDDGAQGGIIDTIARSLALRGVLQQDGEGGWTLTRGTGGILEPLIGSRHIAWLTWADAAGELGSAALGRTTTAWSLLRAEHGGLRITALDAVTPAEEAAALGGVSAGSIAGDGEAVDVTAAGVRPGTHVPGLGTVAATTTARFVRPAAGGLEYRALSWVHDDRGGVWEVSVGQQGTITATPADGASLISRISEGFDSEEARA